MRRENRVRKRFPKTPRRLASHTRLTTHPLTEGSASWGFEGRCAFVSGIPNTVFVFMRKSPEVRTDAPTLVLA